jgi:hypothetical protein
MRQLPPNLSSACDQKWDGQSAARYDEARALVQDTIRRADKAGISRQTLVFALIGEALPHLVREHGPAWASEVLTRLAQRIRSGLI